MPRKEYYGGRGDEVAEDMKKRYGRRWKRVFYATANKRKMRPRGSSRRSR